MRDMKECELKDVLLVYESFFLDDVKSGKKKRMLS